MMERRRRNSLALLLAGCVATVSACTGTTATPDPGSPPQAAVAAFAAAWEHLSAGPIATLTSDPPTAARNIGSVLKNLSPRKLTVIPGKLTQTDSSTAASTATFRWSLAGGADWTYAANWVFTRPAADKPWRAAWASTLINPRLDAGQTVALRATPAVDGTILDRSNQQILVPTTVYSVVAFPDRVGNLPAVAAALARLLGPLDRTVTSASVLAGVRAATPATGYTVTNLRQADYDRVRAGLAGLTGVSVPSTTRNLPLVKDFARVLLSQAQSVTDRMTRGTPGWEIDSIDASGATLDTLAGQPARPGPNVTLTLDSAVQQAAEAALAPIPEPAVLVALQPSTGEILAVAQNQPANVLGSIASTGQYPPGSTIKVVTATAAFDSKLVAPTTPVDCPSVLTVDSRQIHNFESFRLGTVPVVTAFAKSCNTTFAHLATLMPDDALTNAAAQYGIGRDFVIPGITTLTGKIPPADSTVQRAENGFGQGVDLVTPFSEALMAATAATGNMPTPTLIRGTRTTIDRPAPARSALSRSAIRTLMRAVVTDGTGTALRDAGIVYAKTGTADYLDAKGVDRAHAWTIGFRGDLAFSVLIVAGQSSRRTTDIARAFLKAVPAH